MIHYRDHRGTLDESLETRRTYETLTNLYNEIKFSKIEYYADDPRCNQYIYMVFAKSESEESPIGFIFEEKKPEIVIPPAINRIFQPIEAIRWMQQHEGRTMVALENEKIKARIAGVYFFLYEETEFGGKPFGYTINQRIFFAYTYKILENNNE